MFIHGHPEPLSSEPTVDALLSDPEKQALAREFFHAVDTEYDRLGTGGLAKNTVDEVQRRGYPAFITETGCLSELYGYERSRRAPEVATELSEADAVVDAAARMMQDGIQVRGHAADLRSNKLELIPLEPFFPDAANKLTARAQEQTLFMQGMDSVIFFGHSQEAHIRTASAAIAELDARVVTREVGAELASATRSALDELAQEGAYIFSINTRRQDGGTDAQKLGMVWTNHVSSEYFASVRERNEFEI